MSLSHRLIRIATVFFALTTLTSASATAQSTSIQPALRAESVANEITLDAVETRRKSAEESPDLDEESKKKTAELYRQAAEQLKAAQAFDGRGAEYQSRTERAGKDIEAIKRELDRVKAEVETAKQQLERINARLADPDFDPPASLAELDQQYAGRQQGLAKLKEMLAKLEAESTNRANRRKEIRSRLAALEAELSEVNKQLAAAAPAGEHSLLTLAKRTERLAHKQTMVKELPALEGELAAYDAEEVVDKTRTERDLLGQKVSLATLESQISELLRKRKSDNLATDAVRSAQRAAGQVAHAINMPIAERNLALARQNQQVAKDIAKSESERKNLKAELEELKKRFELTRTKVESVGLNASVGAMLRRQRNSLADERTHRAAVAARQPEIDAAQLQLFDLDDERARLADIDAAVAQHLVSEAASNWGVDQRELAAQEARQLLERKSSYLDPLIRSQNAYVDALTDLSITEQQLVQRSKEFANYINERVLWIRSGQPLTPALDTKSAWWLLDAVNWTAGGQGLLEDVKARPYWYLLFVIFSIALVRYAKPMRRRIHAIGDLVQHSSFCAFTPTLHAALFTVLISVVWPALIAFLGWRLSAVADGDAFIRGLARGTYVLAFGYLFLQLLRQLCRPNGLAEAHFQWPKVTISLLRRNLRWLMLLGLPIVMVVATLQASDQDQGRNSLERLFFILGTILVSAVIARAFHPRHGVFHYHLAIHPEGWTSRLRHVWYAIAVGFPLVLGGLALLGYYYTAQHLAWRVYISFVFAMALIVVNGFLHRLLMVHRRRLSIEQARHRRAVIAAAEEADSDTTETPTEVELSIADLSVQTCQTRRLVAAVSLGVAFVGLWLIWVDVLPALDFLERWPLWESTLQITETITNETGDLQTSTRDVINPITIADLILAVLIAAVTLIAAQNVPGLLEISILQRLPFEASIRYAITTLCSYAIILVGLIAAFNAVGLRWSQIQWMATALTFGLAFGLQEMFANFVAGIILLFERPIRVGDIVTVDDISGVVSRVRIRATTITDWDRKDFVVPNKDFITGRVLNWTLSDLVNRVTVKVGIAYGSDTEKAKELLMKIAEEHPQIVNDPIPLATFEEFGESSLSVVLRCFIALRDMPSRLRIIDHVHSRIDQEFKRAHIEIAFPQRDLHVRSFTPPVSIESSNGAPAESLKMGKN